MADRKSFRSASRRTTPQSPPKKAASSNTVASPIHPRRIARVTRSQSRDFSESDVGKTGSRGGRRGTRQAVKDGGGDGGGDGVDLGNQASRRPKQGTRSRVMQDLPTVSEDISVLYPYPNLEESEDVDRTVGHGEASQRLSAISGTTAITSYSMQEPTQVNSEVLLDALPELSYASDQILSMFAPLYDSDTVDAKILYELQNLESRHGKKLQRLDSTFRVSKDVFGTEPYINTSLAVRALLGSKQTPKARDVPWRPDSILEKSNLTTLVTTAILHRQNSQQSGHMFEKLDEDFPSPFLQRFVSSPAESVAMAGCSILLQDTLWVALELRTQICMMLLARYAHQPNFDPDIVLHQTFYESKEKLKGWRVEGMQSDNLSIQFQEQILQRVKNIRQKFPEDENDLRNGISVDLDLLSSTFPWSAFVMQIISWSRLRLVEIERQLIVHGGADSVVKALEGYKTNVQDSLMRPELMVVEENGPLVELEYNPPASELLHTSSDEFTHPKKTTMRVVKTNASKSRISFESAAAVKHLAKRAAAGKVKAALEEQSHGKDVETLLAPIDIHPESKETSSSHPNASSKTIGETQNRSTMPSKIVTEAMAHAPVDDGWPPSDVEEDEDLHVDEAVRDIQKQHTFLDAENNKENLDSYHPTYIEGSGKRAKRAAFIDPQPNAQRVSFDSQESGQHTPEQEDGRGEMGDPSEDEGFQRDTRSVKIRPTSQIRSPPKRRANIIAAQGSRSKRSRLVQENDSAVVENDVGGAVARHTQANVPDSSQAYKMANQQAKMKSALQPKRVQSRRGWSDSETSTLIDLIEEHGTSWAFIKKLDEENQNVLESRDQVGLKDKARNMKFDYLKASPEMPLNFDKVPLNRMQMEKLQELGLYYDQITGRRADDQLQAVDSDSG